VLILIKRAASKRKKASWLVQERWSAICPARHAIRSKTIGVVAIEIAADGEELRDGREFVPSARVGHFPTQPVNASSHGQPGGVIGRRGKVDKRPGERVRFIPPVEISDCERLVHVGQCRTIDRCAENDESESGIAFGEDGIFGESRWFGDRRQQMGIRSGRRCAGSICG
jgi:hypothetical protein